MPPGYEDGEPPFLDEWMEADEALDFLGQMCISALAESLHLYLTERVNDLFRFRGRDLAERGIMRPDPESGAFKKGWINGYRDFFRETLAIDWHEGPANFELLEQIVLARNRVQHPEQLRSIRVRQSKQDQKRFRGGFFADEFELLAWGEKSLTSDFAPPVRLNVTEDKLYAAIDEVEAFCSWLDNQAVFHNT